MAYSFVLHPFLFAAWRILSVYGANAETVDPGEVLKPLSLWLGGTLLGWIALLPLVRDANKRGLILTIALACLTFSPIVSEQFSSGAGAQLSIYAVAVFLIWLVFRHQHSLRGASIFLNTTAICALALALGQTALHLRDLSSPSLSTREMRFTESSVTTGVLPDIYYIVLDGYGRKDVLHEIYDADTDAFLDALKALGFFVADRSLANYCQTYLSLASTLSLDYLDDLAARMGSNSKERRPLKAMIRDSRVVDFLRERGYTFIAFGSGYTGTEIKGADIYLTPDDSRSEFENVLGGGNPLSSPEAKSKRQHFLHRARHLYILNTLSKLPGRSSPQFVFAHIVAPHPPFVFDEDGEFTYPDWKFTFADGNAFQRYGSREDYISGYRAQVQFLSAKLLESIRAIVDTSPDSIIILQGDHGPGSNLNWKSVENTNMWERMSILNALRIPGSDIHNVYPEISPVNTFRLIFSTYLGESLAPLGDRSYFSLYNRPYRFVDVTRRARAGN